MNPGIQFLVAEAIGLGLLVLGLFHIRRRAGLTPLYIVLGVFQPLQVLLAATVYIPVGAGMLVSPSSLTFAASLMAIFLVYVREDALEARKLIYAVLGANLAMTVLLWVASRQLMEPGTHNLLAMHPSIFSQSSRITFVGTVAIVADVLLMIVLYNSARRVFPQSPYLRTLVAMTGALTFDAIVFVTGAFWEMPNYLAMLQAAVASKAVIGVCFSLMAVTYLRHFEQGDVPNAFPGYALRDVFYSLTYRDKFELEAVARRTREQELAEVFARITDAVVSIDREGRYTFVNPQAAQLISRPAHELIGLHVDDILQGSGEQLKAAIHEAMATQCSLEVEEFHPPLSRWFSSRVYPSPQGVTIYFEDVTERITQRSVLERLARTDDLTGLPNRRAARDLLEHVLRRSSGADVGLMLLNMDRLHHINDTLGYVAGDEILQQVAARLSKLVGDSGGFLARLDGDDFVIIQLGATTAGLEQAAAQTSELLSEPYTASGQPVYLSCCVGLSHASGGDADSSQLLGEADLALNLAKQKGRNRIASFSPEQARRTRRRVEIAFRLQEALRTNQFELHLQPLVAAHTFELMGAEALLRWHDSELGQVSPAEFIPVAEDTGLIIPLGDWVLRAAIATQAAWTKELGTHWPISVNVSAVQLGRPDFVEGLWGLLSDAGVEPSRLKLEITESAILEDTNAVVALLERLRMGGVTISLDDFGTGYSSLALLRNLPLDEIKIDQVFTSDVARDGYGRAICRAILSMSRQLGFSVVAEGVETSEQATFLRDAGCGTLQGYLFSPPMPAEAFASLLRQRQPFSPKPGHS